MLKRILTAVFLLSLVSFTSYSQRPPLDRCVRDSLLQVMPHQSQVQMAEIYLELAEMIKDEMPQKSFSYIVSAFKISISEKNDRLKARARMQMGSYFGSMRKFIQAQEHYLAAMDAYKMMRDTTGEAQALFSIGILNRSLRNYPTAFEYLQRGVDLVRKNGNKAEEGKLLEQMALTYQATGDHETAFSYYEKALAAYRQTGDRKSSLFVRNSIGSLYLDENKDDEALVYFTGLLSETDTAYHDIRGIVLTRIGHIYFKKKDYANSLKYNFMALRTRQRGRLPVEVNSSLINIAGDYYKLGKPHSAEVFMNTGLYLAIKSDRKSFVENAYRHLYTYYMEKKDFKRALDYFARYSNVKDELNRERYRNNIAILETKKQLQRVSQSGSVFRRELDIQALNLNLTDYSVYTLKVLTAGTAFSMLVFVLLLLYVRRDRRKMQELNIMLSKEIRDREATEQQTRERETQYKFITDNSGDFITHMDHQKNRSYASPAAMKVYGYDQEEILQKTSGDLTHPDDVVFTEGKLEEMIQTRTSQQFTYKSRKKDGTVFWVESVLNPLFDPATGVFKGMVAVTRDIQERKTKEFEIMEGTRQKENLLKEIHHRVKNNFAILVSLINMQMAQTKNPELLQSLTNLQLRIRTMALVHEMLYRSNDFEKISFPGYLRSLASVIAGTYNRRNVELTIEAEETVMDIEASIPMGLMVNEILSNAYKHAFPDGRQGKIEILFTIDQQAGLHTLVIRDDGIGMPAGDQFRSMGLQVVQILCTQIEGTLVIENTPGASFTITFRPPVK
jgi:PAS domain S-box-containing protein